ncbi:MAG: hypothetical protein WC735_04560 [Candidatus Paceibacterota bacterium]|jgi:hypothetical protein
MEKFKKGDILWGTKRSFKEAWHPIVFIQGPCEAPLAVVLTHDNNHACNILLNKQYDGKQSYFIAHLIEKMSAWGPYTKSNKLELDPDDLVLIEKHIKNHVQITWSQYEACTQNGCPDHK